MSSSNIDVWSDATPLRSQADFRRLLETPRPGAQQSFQKPKPKPTSQKRQQQQQRQHQQQQQQQQKVPETPTLDTKGEAPDQTPLPPLADGKYRDRALERRIGVNPDYDSVTAEATAFIESKGLDDISKISVEDSKILGGDVEHTHLVKGLDFSLLQKERQRLEEERLFREKMPPPEVKQQTAAEVKFLTPMARAVYAHFFDREKNSNVKDNFLPGRTLFVVTSAENNGDEEEEGWVNQDEVRTVRRPRSECQRGGDNIIATRDKGVLDRVAQIVSYISQHNRDGSISKQSPFKQKHKEKQQQIRKNQNVADPDEDIFGDAGTDYAPQPRKKKSSKTVKFDDSGNTYFNAKDDMADIPEAGSAGKFNDKGSDHKKQSSKQQRQQQQGSGGGDIDAMMGMGDAYTECFPEYHSYGGMYVDSDEEDMNQMDTKSKGKSRYDFSTEEEWQKYKLNKEATPKAAFQFGQKMGDGRVNQKNLEGSNQRKQNQKMKSELSKIEGIFKDKGYGHTGAFHEGGGAGGTGGQGGGQNFGRKRKRLE